MLLRNAGTSQSTSSPQHLQYNAGVDKTLLEIFTCFLEVGDIVGVFLMLSDRVELYLTSNPIYLQYTSRALYCSKIQCTIYPKHDQYTPPLQQHKLTQKTKLQNHSYIKINTNIS